MSEPDMTTSAAATPDGKLTVVLLAHHHGSDNIASQRFRGLLRYLPRSQYKVQVLCGPWQRSETELNLEVTCVSAPLLAKASAAARLWVLGAMLRSGKVRFGKIGGDSWIAKAVDLARTRVRAELAAGNQVVVMATYSPVDALIAARLVAQAEGVPFVQDFRDGLAYESLGRKGTVFCYLRQVLEGWAVRHAAGITSVTRSLVAHFAASYPETPTHLLYNGFDNAEFPINATVGPNSESTQVLKVTLGHFGRVSASEAARLRTFTSLLDYLERAKFMGILSFFGELTDQETDLLARSPLCTEIHGQVSRQLAVENMRSMAALLVVTGESEGVATGKIFEYLFSGPRIILATLRRNEAARLLEEIGDDDMVLDFSDPATIPAQAVFAEHLRRPFTRNRERIRRFEKSAQALELAAILQDAAATRAKGEL